MKNTKKRAKRAARAVSLALAGSLLLLPQIGTVQEHSYAAAINDSNVQSLEEKIANLKNTQDELQTKIASVKNEAAKASEYKEYMDSMVSATSQKMVLAEELIDELTSKIEDSETKIAEKEESITAAKAKLVERVRYAQENGTVGEIELLLDSNGLSDFLTRLDRVSAMMEYDRELMNEYKAEKESLEQYKATLEASKALQNDTLTQLEADKASYAAASAEKANYMTSLAADKAQYEAEYKNAQAAEEELNAELTAYIQKMQEQSQVVPSGDGMIRPLPVGVGYISSHFGWRNLNGYQDYHQATDIACATGTSIYASDSGKVLRAQWHSSYGNYILIDHGGGISTLYAHCSGLNVSAGQMVNKGDVIGFVGETGYAFGAHLHFEVRVNGTRVDAEGYVNLG